MLILNQLNNTLMIRFETIRKKEPKEAGVTIHPAAMLLETFRKSGIKAEELSAQAREAIRQAEAELRDWGQSVDGARVDLDRANTSLHTEVIKSLGAVVSSKTGSGERDALVSKGLGLLEVKQRLADKE